MFATTTTLGWGSDRTHGFQRSQDVLVFEGFPDAGEEGLLDDLAPFVTVSDAGPGLDVTVDFGFQALTFVGAGTGAINSIDDLLDDPASQLVNSLIV